MSKKVVLFTHSGDAPALIPEMTQALQARGAQALRFDSDRFPMDCRAEFVQDGETDTITFSDGNERVTLAPDDAIWYRRARHAERLPLDMDRQLRAACVEESKSLLRGLIAAAPCFVLDSPDLVGLCGHKPRQQRLARELGLATPRTLMTNDAAHAERFLRSCEQGAIAKMLSAFSVIADNADKRDEQVVFTTAMNEEHIRKLDGLRYCPMVFQERIEKRLELRITAIGRRLYAAAVDSQATPGAEVDWRERGVTLINAWTPYTLPADIEAKLHAYMDRIGMQYSAIDMIVEPSGRHVFLEANPAGEFFWLQTGSPHFPFIDALADVLTNQPGSRRETGKA